MNQVGVEYVIHESSFLPVDSLGFLEGSTKNLASHESYIGAPAGTRTPNPQVRSLVLYPIELRVQK